MSGQEDLLGRPLRSVSVSADKKVLTFEFEDGKRAVFDAVGDCCSQSWIEHLEAPGDIAGAVLTEAPYCMWPDAYKRENVEEWGVLQYYQAVFRTNRGDIVVEFRNSSNGYYGGSLERRP